MKPVRLLALCLVVAFLSACHPVLAESTLPAQESDHLFPTSPVPKPTIRSPESDASGPKSGQPLWTLTYSRSGGFAGINKSVKIDSSGSVLDSQGQKISAPADEVSALIAEINQLDFSSFDEAYGNSSDCRDCFTYKLTFEQEGKAKTITMVEDGSSELPKELQSILQKLNEFATAN
jgi:hypothetical protein